VGGGILAQWPLQDERWKIVLQSCRGDAYLQTS
jgi:hypothetical protein